MVGVPAWHFELTDGVTTINALCTDPSGEELSLRHWRRDPLARSAMKLGQGRTKYDDLLPPWYSIAQDDWSGGRGSQDLSDDPTKYADGANVQTHIPGRLVLGPEIHEDLDTEMSIEITAGAPYSLATVSSAGTDTDRAQTFTVTSDMMVIRVDVYLSSLTYVGDVCVQIRELDGNDKPSTTVITWATRSLSLADQNAWYEFDVTRVVLEAGSYAVVVLCTGTSGILYWDYDDVDYSGGAPFVWSGSQWDSPSGWAATADMITKIVDEGTIDEAAGVEFYKARGLVHAVVQYQETAEVWRRGQLGLATGATQTTLSDSSETFTTGVHVSQVLALIDGTGAGQRRLVSGASGSALTISDPWDIVPDTTTIYAITRDWEKVDELDGMVSGVLVVDGITYFARGAEEYVHRHQWTDAGGDAFADDGTNNADRLLLFRDENNDPAIWRSLGHEISAASIAAWGTDLVFGTAVRVGSGDTRITSVVVYDDHLYICKEDGLWAIQEDIVRLVPVDFAALRAPENGRGMTAWNLYLIFPLLESLERLYGSQVDDFGPNLGRGLPSGRQGRISALLTLPGLLVAAVDAGDYYSSILMFNQLGWHELVRSSTAGARITSLAYEVLLDNNALLWWHEGGTFYYVWMSQRTFDRSRDDSADYATSGTITLAWMGTDLQDVVKTWREVSIFKAEDQTFEGSAAVAVSYRLDDESANWVSASKTSTSDTLDRFSLANVQGRRLQLKITLSEGGDVVYGYTTPEIEAITVDALGRIQMAHAYQTNIALELATVSTTGKAELRDPDGVLATLDTWSGSPKPLTLTHVLDEFDGKSVALEPVTVRVTEYRADGEAKRVVSLTLVELA